MWRKKYMTGFADSRPSHKMQRTGENESLEKGGLSDGGIYALRSWGKRFSTKQDMGRNSNRNFDGGGS